MKTLAQLIIRSLMVLTGGTLIGIVLLWSEGLGLSPFQQFVVVPWLVLGIIGSCYVLDQWLWGLAGFAIRGQAGDSDHTGGVANTVDASFGVAGVRSPGRHRGPGRLGLGHDAPGPAAGRDSAA